MHMLMVLYFQDTEEKPPRRHRTTSSHSDFENTTRDRSRHSSGASTTKRRIRANSSSSNHHSECINATKKLRVEVTKVDDMIKTENSELEASSSDEITGENAERSQRKKLRSRRSADTNSSEKTPTSNSLSPVSKKRRSELDKLLEAGLSSFHCESAKQAADRLGPLKVDVSDGSEAGSYEASENIKSPGKSRLLQEADVNQNSKSPGRRASRSPKKGGRGGGRGRGRRVGNKANDSEADLSVSPVSSAFSPCVPNDIADALKRVDSHEVEISSMDFSFERTPFRESWFQTYTRQDAGDEILYYPETESFPLPYEMPMNTFYPRKEFKKQLNMKSGRNTPSGTATPDEEEIEPTPTRSTRRGQEAAAQPSTSKNSGKSTKNKNQPFSSEELSFFEKIGPKKAAALRAASERKSPRGHASTKSLNAASPYVDDVDDAEFEELIDGAKKPVKKYVLAYKAMMANYEGADPEASNDSVASSISTRKDESLEKLGEIAGQLESFFSANSLEDASLLPASSTSDQLHKKRSRRQSSSEKTAGTKKVKKSKNNEAGEILDKLLDSNVDPVFLDCLEDELPSVVFDEHHPKLDTMDLINDFDQCTSINLFKKKQKRKEIMESAVASDSEAATPLASKDASSTILRRLLTHSTETKKKKVAASKNNRSKALDIPMPIDDSSSECNSAFETASVASSTSRRKRKRNMTGFPSPKKKKKIIKAVPAPPPPAPSSSAKPVKVKKIIIPKKSTLRKAAEKAARKAKAQEAKSGKASVQLKLKMSKNGLGLQRPSKSPTKVPSATTTLAASKKAKPSPKSPPAKKTSTKRTSRSSVPPPPPKTEVIPIESSDDEDDNDDVEDRTFRLKNKVTKKRKRTKKKRRPLTVKSKKPVIPKLINTDDDDDDDNNDEVDVENEAEDSDDSVVSSAEEEDTSDEDNEDSDEEEEEEDEDENSDEEDSDDASDEEDRPIKPKLKKAGPKGRRSLRARNNKS